MTTPDLTPTLREALNTAIAANRRHGFFSDDDLDALCGLRDACPERPVLEDGIYEAPDGDGGYHLRYVRDGHYSEYRNPDDTLPGGGRPLPADVSTWRRIDGPPTVTAEQVEAAARAVAGYPVPQWATLSEGLKAPYRARARRILAAAGIEVRDV